MRWQIVRGEMLYQADVILVHNPNLFDDLVYLKVEPSRSGAWLAFSIECALLSKGLLVFGLDIKRLRRCIRYKELSFP